MAWVSQNNKYGYLGSTDDVFQRNKLPALKQISKAPINTV